MKAADATVARRAVRGGEDDVEVGDAAVGDEALGAVEDVGVAVAPRGGGHRGDVGAGARLGERHRAEAVALDDRLQQALLLLVGAGQQDRDAGEMRAAEDGRHAAAAPGQLFGDDAVGQFIGDAQAAELLGEGEGRQAQLARLAHQLPRELFALVQFRRDGADLLLGEGMRKLLHGLLLVGEGEVDHRRQLHDQVSLDQDSAEQIGDGRGEAGQHIQSVELIGAGQALPLVHPNRDATRRPARRRARCIQTSRTPAR